MRRQNRTQSSGWGIGLLSSTLFISITPLATAQIIPDNTLGAESSIVAPGITVRGGALRGVNLFHSFSEFNVANGAQVYFANPANVENILTRVTGTNRSEILGRLGVNGTANLFLINPNGILFGSNASLDVRGSFVASTASSLIFPNGEEFSAANPQAAPLLAVNLKPGLQYGTRAIGDIRNEATLAVSEDQTLTLFGNTVTSIGALIAPGGVVQVLGDRVGLFGHAQVDVSSPNGGGTVLIGGDFQGNGTIPNAHETFVGANATIQANATTSGNGGKVIVWADGLTQFYGTINAKGGVISGNGGMVEVSGKASLAFDGRVDTSAPSGSMGMLLLDPTNITVTNLSPNLFLSTVDDFSDPDFPFNGSINVSVINNALTNVTLQATNNIIFDAAVDITALGVGLTAQAGNNIFINAPMQTNGGEIRLIANDTASGSPSGTGSIFINAGTIAYGADMVLKGVDVIAANGVIFGSGVNSPSGNTGNITVDITGRLFLPEGAVASTTNNGPGNAGNINVKAQTVELVGVNPTTGISGGLFTWAPGVTGNAGNVLIETEQLKVQNGAYIFTGTHGAGHGGDIEIRARTIEVSGINRIDGRSSIISSQNDDSAAIGNSGKITIDANQINLLNQGKISTGSQGFGNSGELLLTANILVLQNQSGIISSSNGVGDAAKLSIQAGSISLADGSYISSAAFGLGNAADLSLNVDNTLNLSGNSVISATSQPGGTAGNISIEADRLTVQNSSIGRDRGSDIVNAGNLIIKTHDAVTLTDNSILFVGTQFGTIGSNLVVESSQLNLDYSLIQLLTTSLGNAGDVTIKTRDEINLRNNSFISADGFALGNGSDFLIETGRLNIENTSGISTAVLSQDRAGNLIVRAQESVNLMRGGTLQTSASDSNSGGDLSITTPTLTLQELSTIGSLQIGDGQAGNISVAVDNALTLDRSLIFSSNLGSGSGGNIFVQAGRLMAQGAVGEAGISTTSVGRGNAGNIAVHTRDSVTLASGAAISATALGSGNGGAVSVDTRRLVVQDGAQISTVAFDPTSINDTRILNQFPSQYIDLIRGILELEQGNFSQGNAGDLTIRTTDSIDLLNRASVSTSGAGRAVGGDIAITTSNLNIDRATVSAGTIGFGTAGNIQIQAQNIRLDNQGNVNSNSTSGNGGNINVQNFDLLRLRRGSFISATAGTFGAGGDGGNITIQGQFILAPLFENSDIKANAFDGRGGQVNVTVQQIFGMVPRSRADLVRLLRTRDPRQLDPIKLQTNDITAISQNNPSLNGQVSITTLGVDPTRGLAPLPSNPPPPPIAQNCQATGRDGESQFLNTGRGGLLPNPTDTLSGQSLWQDDRSTAPVTSATLPPPVEQIIEAQGWVKTADGTIILTEQSMSNSTTSYPTQLNFLFCNGQPQLVEQ